MNASKKPAKKLPANSTWQVGQASKRYVEGLPSGGPAAPEQRDALRAAFAAGAKWQQSRHK